MRGPRYVFFLNHAVTAVTDESDFTQLCFQGFVSSCGEIGARERSAMTTESLASNLRVA